MNFHEGKIQVGDMKNRELILEYKDPLPMRVRYIGFKSVSRVGSWKFYESKSGEKTLDNRIFFSPVVYIQTLFINMIGYQFFYEYFFDQLDRPILHFPVTVVT